MKKKNIYFKKVIVVGFVKIQINFQFTKKVPVIFHNLRGYDSHLIFNELDKFDVKISVMPNGLEKYMAFFFNKTCCLLIVCNS